MAWGLRLGGHSAPVPPHAITALATPPAAAPDLTRLLGTPPVAPVVVPEPGAAPVADNRYKLIGVLAPRAGSGTGWALISVDGKPAATFRVGKEVDPGLRVMRVGHRRVDLGGPPGTAPVVLELPALPEAARGQPGGAALAPGSASPAALPANAAAHPQPAMPSPAGQGVPVQTPAAQPMAAVPAGNMPQMFNPGASNRPSVVWPRGMRSAPAVAPAGTAPAEAQSNSQSTMPIPFTPVVEPGDAPVNGAAASAQR